MNKTLTRLVTVASSIILMFGFSACSKSEKPTKTSQDPSMQISGRESWTDNGETFEIESSSVIVFPSGENLYAINVLVDKDVDVESCNPMAIQVARYAKAHGYYDLAKQKISHYTNTPLLPNIGIAVIQRVDIGGVRSVYGSRYQITPEELESTAGKSE